MLQCELLALLIVKFNAFAKGFGGKTLPEELLQTWDLLPWHKDPSKDKKAKFGLLPWLDT